MFYLQVLIDSADTEKEIHQLEGELIAPLRGRQFTHTSQTLAHKDGDSWRWNGVINIEMLTCPREYPQSVMAYWELGENGGWALFVSSIHENKLYDGRWAPLSELEMMTFLLADGDAEPENPEATPF